MRFPFVLRSDHEEIVRALREQLEAAKKQYQLLYDTNMLRDFGTQVFGSFPKEVEEALRATAPKVEPEAPHHQDTEEDEDARRLVSLKRTSPSRVGPELSRMMSRNVMKQARAANPGSKFMAAVERAGNA